MIEQRSAKRWPSETPPAGHDSVATVELDSAEGDPRAMRMGRILRKTSLDEPPQLWTVFEGEMSLVGPRPHQPRESEVWGESRNLILRLPPGNIGPWQAAGRNQFFFEDRVRMDTYYVREWSVWLDLVILARTVRTVVFGRGAYQTVFQGRLPETTTPDARRASPTVKSGA